MADVSIERALTANERAALGALLTVDFPGVAELRAQLPGARVVGRCGCGCPTIHVAVDRTLPMADVPQRVPVEAALDDGGLLLFVDGGFLSSLERYTFEEVTPVDFPPVDRIVPVVRGSR